MAHPIAIQQKSMQQTYHDLICIEHICIWDFMISGMVNIQDVRLVQTGQTQASLASVCARRYFNI